MGIQRSQEFASLTLWETLKIQPSIAIIKMPMTAMMPVLALISMP